jgi:hypothetical protein
MQRLEAGLGTLVGMGALSSHPDNPHLAIVLAEALLTDGLFVQAGNWADQAMAGAEELGQPEVVAAALACKGKAAHAAGRWREAIGLLTGAQAMADELEFTNVQLGALLALSNVWQLVRPARALKEAQRALTLARRLGMPREETEAISAVSLLALLTEGRDGVERVSKGAQGTSPQQGITGAFRTVAEHVLDGELGMALDLLRKMQSETSISLESWIVEIRLLRQALAGEGRRAAAEALSTVRETGGYGNSARPYAQAGRAALWSHDPHGVEAALGAIDGFKPNGTPWVQLTKSALGAGLDSLTGSSPKTAAVYGRSIAQADEIGAAFDAALLQFDLGLLTASDETDSTEVMDEAERRFTQLGANGLWKRLDETTRDGWRTNGHV